MMKKERVGGDEGREREWKGMKGGTRNKKGRQKGTVEGRRMWEGMSDWRGRNDSCLRYCYKSFQVLVYLC